jgi:hypothetical protein
MATTASLRLISSIFVASLLSACGGSSDSISSRIETDFPVEAVFTGVATDGVLVSARAVDGGNTWTLTWEIQPTIEGEFENMPAQQYIGIFTIQQNGSTVLSSIGLNYFTTNPYAPLGLVLANGNYGVQSKPADVLPATAFVGTGGSLGTITVYEKDDREKVLSTQETTWSLKAGDDDSTAFLCTQTIAKNSSDQDEATTTGCFKINSVGAVLGAKWTLGVGGKSLTFK